MAIDNPEKRLLRRIEYFGHTIELVNRNFRFLEQALDNVRLGPKPRHLLDTTDDWRRHDLLKELSFALHDYLAAVKSLVDHSRTLYHQVYQPTGLFPEYESEAKRVFATDGVIQTVQGLREMAQHYELPNITSRRTLSDDNSATRIVLKRDDLLKYSGWKAPAKRFIAAAGDDIDLSELCVSYQAKVTAFYEWMYDHLRRIHAHDLEKVNRSELEAFAKHLPGIISSVRSKVAYCERTGEESMPWAFGQLIGPKDRRLLSHLEREPIAWTEAALAIVTSRVSVPDELIARLRKLAERTPAAG
jgi:hypothetical protein